MRWREAVRVALEIEYRDHVTLAMRECQCATRRGAVHPRTKSLAPNSFSRKPKEAQLQGVEQIYAARRCCLNEYAPYVETLVQALRIGELGIATSPCETFVETGLAIKTDSPLKPTFTIELANDYCGYLPTAEHHELGGYETWRARSSFLEVAAEEKIRKTALDLLKQVAAG